MAEIEHNLRFSEMFDGGKYISKGQLDSEYAKRDFEDQTRQKHNQIEYEQAEQEHIKQAKERAEQQSYVDREEEESASDDDNKDENEVAVNADEEMINQLKTMADKGDDAEALAALAVTYANMSMTKEAVKYFRKVADMGYAPAQRNLAITLENGDKVNYKKVFELYNQSASQGDIYALNNLGCLYTEGNGIEVDYAKAAECFEKAADLGDNFAKVNYADMLITGIGTVLDKEKAFSLYREAAEKGNSAAMTKAADCYLNGKGVKADINKAIKLYKNAEQLGDETAAEKLKAIQSKKDPQKHRKPSPQEQIAEAKKVADLINKANVEKRAVQQKKQEMTM